MRHSILAVAAAFAVGSAAFAAGAKEPADSRAAAGADAKPVVAVSILPQSYFAGRIAGDRAEVVVIVGPGQSPHSYEPSPRQMAELSKARLWVTAGVEFEHGLEPKIRSLYPGMKVADGTRGIVFRNLEVHSHEEGDEHAEEHEGEADVPGSKDPHVWLGRQASKAMAANIRDALSELDPAGAVTYEANYRAFAAEADAAFDALKLSLAPLKGRAALVFHPAFGYFLDEFGIRQVAVETGGKEPTPKALTRLVEEAKEEGAAVVFVQAQFPAAAAKTVADAIGGVVQPLDPLAPDWAANVARIGEALQRAVR